MRPPGIRAPRWWTRSIANRITASTALLVTGLVLALAVLAYATGRSVLLRNAEEDLRNDVVQVAERLALRLGSVESDLANLAANSLVVNGLFDSSGRGAYLGPFLRDLRDRDNAHRILTLTDHTGMALASNAQGDAPDYRKVDGLRQVIDSRRARAWIAPAATATLVVAYPVVLASSGQAEGALLMELPLAPLFAEAARALAPEASARLSAAGSPLLRGGAAGVDPAAAPAGVAARPADAMRAALPLSLREALAGLQLELEVSLPRGHALEGLSAIALRITAAGLLAVLAASAFARVTIRRLLRPLEALSAVSQRIRQEHRFDLEVPAHAHDEIGEVALSVNEMLASLRQAHETLEAQVAARTEALDQTRAHLDAVQRQMNDGLLLVDTSGRIEAFSGACDQLFDHTPHEMIGRGIAALLPEWPSLIARSAVGVSEKGRFQCVATARRRGGKFVADISVSLLVFGARSQWVVLVRDATAQRDGEARLREANARLEGSVRQLRRRDEDMAQINTMNELLASCQSLQEAHEVIAPALVRLFDGHVGALAVHGENDQYEVIARWGAQDASRARFALDDCWSLRLGRLHDAGSASAPACRHCSPGVAGMRCLPLSVQGETLGVLMSVPAPGVAADEMHRLEGLLDVVGEAVKFGLSNLRLREALRAAALRDPLTGLYNRRFLDETAPRELERARRSGTPLSLVSVDLDHFKRFNDHHGHAAGDLVLRATARTMADGLRATDIVCRVGGEEIVALLPGASAEEARERVQTLCLALSALSLQHEGQPLPAVTLSVGVAEAAPGLSLEAVFRAADEALYTAKAQGRNRIVVAPAPVLRPVLAAEATR
ncbi:MAG TPA: diguanylate cyclase [Burkholderiaceae bacterium]|nr:diguanylate cyclase [Burkholderiaceae bacterium]